jgi:hypothetical protein
MPACGKPPRSMQPQRLSGGFAAAAARAAIIHFRYAAIGTENRLRPQAPEWTVRRRMRSRWQPVVGVVVDLVKHRFRAQRAAHFSSRDQQRELSAHANLLRKI